MNLSENLKTHLRLLRKSAAHFILITIRTSLKCRARHTRVDEQNWPRQYTGLLAAVIGEKLTKSFCRVYYVTCNLHVHLTTDIQIIVFELSQLDPTEYGQFKERLLTSTHRKTPPTIAFEPGFGQDLLVPSYSYRPPSIKLRQRLGLTNLNLT